MIPCRPPLEEGTMIKRIWHGWTTHANADRYEALLKEEIFPGTKPSRCPATAVYNCCAVSTPTRWSSSH